MLSASFIATTATHTDPADIKSIAFAIICAGILDLDHVFFLIKDRAFYKTHGYKGNLHKARSVFHELIGLMTVGFLGLLLSFFSIRYAQILFISLTIHLVEDVIMGTSTPFMPVNKTEIKLFSFTFKQKTAIDIIVSLIFGGLWLLFLKK